MRFLKKLYNSCNIKQNNRILYPAWKLFPTNLPLLISKETLYPTRNKGNNARDKVFSRGNLEIVVMFLKTRQFDLVPIVYIDN